MPPDPPVPEEIVIRFPCFRIRALMIAVAVGALALGAFLVYASVCQPPAEVVDFIRMHDDQPQPERVGTGVSPVLLWLLFLAPAGETAIIAWKRHSRLQSGQ